MKAVWKGNLSFGLVNIPVQMYTASQEKEISFVLLHKKDLSEIRYAKICKAEDKEIPWNEVVKGYEYEKGNFVVLDEKDFEKAYPQKTKNIEILHFIDEKEVDSVYYAKPYFLEPAKNAENAYSLLRTALKKSKKVGLAKYVLRNREHLALVKMHGDIIVLNELRYKNEIIHEDDLKLPKVEKFSEKEIKMALQLIELLHAPFKPEEYRDTFTQEIKQIIKKKAKGAPIHPKAEKAPSTKIHDIMSLLQASLESSKKPSKKSRKIA